MQIYPPGWTYIGGMMHRVDSGANMEGAELPALVFFIYKNLFFNNNTVMVGLRVSMHFQQFEDLIFKHFPGNMPRTPPPPFPS